MYYILDNNFIPLAAFENYISFLWTDRNRTGSIFACYVQAGLLHYEYRF